MTTISQLRQALRQRLKPVADDLAPFETDSLFGEVLSLSPTELTLHAARELSAADERAIEQLAERRLTGLPLVYVLGHTQFFGLDLKSDARALIPRPETEELVEVALGCLPEQSEGHHPLVVDIGTGSGNIALALAHERPDLRVYATDTELPALELANENRAGLDLTDRVTLIAGRSLSMFRKAPMIDMIVTNPPYIAFGNPHVEPSVIEHEPRVAVFSGPSGLEVLIELLVEAVPRLVPGGWFVTEIGYDQSDVFRHGLYQLPEWGVPVFHRDLGGIDRIMVVQRQR